MASRVAPLYNPHIANSSELSMYITSSIALSFHLYMCGEICRLNAQPGKGRQERIATTRGRYVLVTSLSFSRGIPVVEHDA